MPQLKIMGFDGVIPRTSATMLQDNQAQIAEDVKLYSKELRYWRGPTVDDYTPPDNTATLYKYYYNSADDYKWLTWGTDVNVVRGPIADTTDYRLYYTGDGAPKKTYNTIATTGSGPYPAAWLYMGVPAPAAAPTVTRVGTGTADPESRVYVYTYVSTFGGVTEESAPSPASSIVTVYTGDSVTVNGFATTPTTGYNITHRRIYRSVTGATTDNFLLVAEIPIATTSYSDTKTAEQLGEAIGTTGWAPPPTDLAGLLSHPSGALAGFSGNTVYFSEPFYPHAWPLGYALSIPDKIIGLGIYGTSIAVMTDRHPYIITGSYPGAMSAERVPILEPCVSKPSIYSDEFGVVYASPNGMVGIGPSMRGVITTGLFAYNEWNLYMPHLIAGVVTNNQYFAIYPQNVSGMKTMVINRADVPALSFVDMKATAVHIDSKTAQLHYIDSLDGRIKQWDADELNPLAYTWKSKRFVMPIGTTFSAMKLDGDFGQIGNATIYNQVVAEIQARNTAKFSGDLLGTLNSTTLNYSYKDTAIPNGIQYHGIEMNGSTLETVPTLASIRSVQVTFYGDGVKIDPALTVTTFDPVRIMPFKSRTVEVEITGTLNIRSIALGTTVAELHQ